MRPYLEAAGVFLGFVLAGLAIIWVVSRTMVVTVMQGPVDPCESEFYGLCH